MAFKKIDFSKLRERTPEERAQDEARREQAAIDADDKRRSELSKKSVMITLAGPLERRSTMSGDTIASFRGMDEQGRAVSGSYFVPSYMSRDEQDAMLDGPKEGDRLKLDGYWKMREWRNQDQTLMKTWEFQAQRFSHADGRENERGLKGPLAQASEILARREANSAPVLSRGPEDSVDAAAFRQREQSGRGR